MPAGAIQPSKVAAQKRPRKNLRLPVTIGLVLVAVFSASLLLCRSSSASTVELTSAGLVPADAFYYAAINTDFDSSQWVAAFKLAERFGAEDPEQQLKDGATEGGLDWEKDVKPFLGGDAAFFLRSGGDGVLQFDGGLILRCTDTAKAMAIVRDMAADEGITLERRPYANGVYEAASDGSMFIAILGDHIAASPNEGTLRAIVDTYQKRQPALRDSETFQNVRDQVVKDFLVFNYIDPAQLAENDPSLKEDLDEFGLFGADTAFAGVITAESDLFTLQQAFPAGEGDLTSLLQPRTPTFAERVPANTSLFVSTTDLASIVSRAPTDPDPAGDEFDPGSEDLFLGAADFAWLFAGAPFRLAEMRELSELFTGEMAVASWSETDDLPAGSVLLAEVEDAERARQLAVELASGAVDHESRNTITIAGNEVTVVEDGAVAVVDGVLIAGSLDGVRVVIEGPPATLSTAPAFTRAAQRLGAPLGSFIFFNVSAFISDGLLEADDPLALALESVLFNGVQADGLTRFSAIVLATEE